MMHSLRNSLGKLLQKPAFPVLAGSLLSLLVLSMSLYLTLFAGRSLLPGPLAVRMITTPPLASMIVPPPAASPEPLTATLPPRSETVADVGSRFTESPATEAEAPPAYKESEKKDSGNKVRLTASLPRGDHDVKPGGTRSGTRTCSREAAKVQDTTRFFPASFAR